MARLTLKQKMNEFKNNFDAMKESEKGREVYTDTFADQNQVENLLASGGGEDLGTLENELASLSAMNTIRESERRQAFGEDMLFDRDIHLGMRDAGYVEATGEMRRRKAIKSHRWDKTRKRRMNTSRETLSSANDKIRALKASLHHAGHGAAPMTVMQRVESMKSIYDQIRIADRNFAEAVALNSEEENKLKDKAELTYCRSMQRMLEREMKTLPQNSREYAKLRVLAQLNNRVYEELMRPIIAQHEEDQVNEAKRDLNRKDEEAQEQRAPLMDEEAEAHVTANINVFSNFCLTLNDRKYGNELDELWNEMKSRADDLLHGWDIKTDLQRGDALGDLLIAANKLLCREGRRRDTDKARDKAAKQFRSFFKSVLESMSINCRVLALERIFKKVDDLDDDPNIPDALKEANQSVFTELARERYRRENPEVDENDDALKVIDDMHYRVAYAHEKLFMHSNNVLKVFGNTKEYKLANLKFPFDRSITANLIADDFRLDRFGNVIPEDIHKKEQWENLIKDIADADMEKARKLVKRFYARSAAKPVDPGWFTEKGFKKGIYEYKSFSQSMTVLQNFATDWKKYNEATTRDTIREWNQAHPDDMIPEDYLKKHDIDPQALRNYTKGFEELPSMLARITLDRDMGLNYFIPLMDSKGIRWANVFEIGIPNDMRELYYIRKLLKNPREAYTCNNWMTFPLIHRDGTEFDIQTDVQRGRPVQNEQNPLVFIHERSAAGLRERAENIANYQIDEFAEEELAGPEVIEIAHEEENAHGEENAHEEEIAHEEEAVNAEAQRAEEERLAEEAYKERERQLENTKQNITAQSKVRANALDKAEDQRQRMLLMLDAYETLKEPGKTLEQAFALKESMVSILIELTGVKRSSIEFIPTDAIRGFIEYYLENNKKEDCKETLKSRIEAKDNSYLEPENEEKALQRAAELFEKDEAMNALDKLLLYDHNTLLIAMNRNSPEEDEENDIHYDDLKEIDQETLTRYARQASEFGRADAGDDAEYEDLTEERIEKLSGIAREILSEYTGKDKAYFDVLTLKEMASFAYDIHDLVDKEYSEETKKKCIARVEELNKRIALLDDAVKEYDRKKISAAIQELTGVEEDELKGLMTVDLFNMANSFYGYVGDETKMKEAVDNALGLATTRTPEYYELKFQEAYDNLLEQENAYGQADERSWTIWREYAVRYLPARLGLKGLDEEDYKDVDPKSLRRAMDNAEIIRIYRQTPPQDDTERNDLNMAIRSFGLAAQKLSERAKAGYEKALDINFDEFPEVKAFEMSGRPMVSAEGLRDHVPAEADEQRRIESQSRMNEDRRLYWSKELWRKQYKADREKAEEENGKSVINEEKKETGYSKEALMTKAMFADLITAVPDVLPGVKLSDKGKKILTDKVKNILSMNADVLRQLTSDDKEKGTGYVRIFMELKAGAAEQEKEFMRLCEESLSDIMSAAASLKKGALSPAELNGMLKSGKLDKAIGGLMDRLPALIENLEKNVIPVMERGTRGIFGQNVEEEDVIITKTILGNDIDEEITDSLEEKEREEKIQKAGTLKEKLALEEKSGAQRARECAMLEKMDNKVRYDASKGQGRFIQLLVSNYYKEAPVNTKRRMLSHIIRDMNRKTDKKKETENGCSYFASAVKGAGPLMQKMMQGVPERMVIGEMGEVLSMVKSSLAPIDRVYADKVFAEIKNDAGKKIKSINSRVSLGAASIAETFECEITDKSDKKRNIVVKILRPDAAERMKEEKDLIARMAMYADMTDEEVRVYEDKNGRKYDRNDHVMKVTESGFYAQYAEIEKELDFKNEAANCKMGKDHYVDRYYDKANKCYPRHVNSVAIDKTLPQGKNYIIMDKAKGETADKIIKRSKDTRTATLETFRNTNRLVAASHAVNAANIGEFWNHRRKMYMQMDQSFITARLLEDLAYVWSEQAIFGGLIEKKNFIHGDMHAGNIMIDLANRQSTVLDYGNAILLDTDRINAIVNMTTAAGANRADIFVEHFDKMLKYSARDEAKSKQKVGYAPMSAKIKAAYKKRLDEVFKLGDPGDNGKRIMVALSIAQELGIKMPKEMQNFSQCEQRLENTVMDVKNETLKLCEGIDIIDNLPVDDADQDSVDPLIRLHIYRQQQRSSGREDSRDIILEYAKRYKLMTLDNIYSDVGDMEKSGDAATVIDTYLPEYSELKKKIDPVKTAEAADDLMKAFEQVDGLQRSGKSVSQDDIAALEDARKRIVSLISDNETIRSMTEGYDLSGAIRMIWDQGKTDSRSVYRIYNLMKKRIPAIIEAGDGIVADAEYIEKTGEENIFETKLGQNTGLAIREAVDQRNMSMASAEELSNALRSLDKDEYERQTSRMHKKHKGLKELYKEYRNAEENLKTAKAGGDRQAVEKYRAEAEKCETVYVQRFMDCSNIEVERSATGFYKNVVLSNLRGFQGRKEYIGLKDFATVMGLCCKDNISRLVAFKIDMKLALELNSMRVLSEMEEKAIKAQEEALKKGDPESLKEAKRIQEEYEAKRKEIEEEKKRKMEELDRKAEEALRKEEEKRLKGLKGKKKK